ncbi:MAG: LLM class flavin-dependent oxidoreductase [Streptomycetaceae bacterium]|nr:LLM class flavin-dependent oxidoreductase [Streptomycetaceae bacterium]
MARTPIRLGMMAPFADGLITDGGFLRDLAATLEDCGVESLWTVEHVVVAEDYEPPYPYSASGRTPSGGEHVPMPDPLETIAFLAGASATLRFGTAVVVAPLHSPVVLAKRAATIDRHSDGRFMLGLGIGDASTAATPHGGACSEPPSGHDPAARQGRERTRTPSPRPGPGPAPERTQPAPTAGRRGCATHCRRTGQPTTDRAAASDAPRCGHCQCSR